MFYIFRITLGGVYINSIYYKDWIAASFVTGYCKSEIENAYRRRVGVTTHDFNIGGYNFEFLPKGNLDDFNILFIPSGRSSSDNLKQTHGNF